MSKRTKAQNATKANSSSKPRNLVDPFVGTGTKSDAALELLYRKMLLFYQASNKMSESNPGKPDAIKDFFGAPKSIDLENSNLVYIDPPFDVKYSDCEKLTNACKAGCRGDDVGYLDLMRLIESHIRATNNLGRNLFAHYIFHAMVKLFGNARGMVLIELGGGGETDFIVANFDQNDGFLIIYDPKTAQNGVLDRQKVYYFGQINDHKNKLRKQLKNNVGSQIFKFIFNNKIGKAIVGEGFPSKSKSSNGVPYCQHSKDQNVASIPTAVLCKLLALAEEGVHLPPRILKDFQKIYGEPGCVGKADRLIDKEIRAIGENSAQGIQPLNVREVTN